MYKREVLAPLLLFGLFGVLGVAFALFNLHLREAHRELMLHGVATTGSVVRVIYSNKSCNSNVVVSYHDLGGHLWLQKFQTCFANHALGESIDVTYLRTSPDTAMLNSGESPYTENMLNRGLWIGLALSVFSIVMIVRAIRSLPS